jgi:glycosyltransferase involved in cell wall biosynthesis
MQVVASARGGGAVHVRELAAGLAQAGRSVVVVMGRDQGHVAARDIEAEGARCVAWGGAPDRLLHAVWSLAAVLRRTRPALVHAHGARAALATHWALPLARAGALPFVWSVHGYVTPFHARPRRWVQSYLDRAIAGRAQMVVAVSQAERHALVAGGFVPQEKIATVQHGLDLGPFAGLTAADRTRARAGLGVPPDARVVATVCRLDRPRDFDTLLRAFRRVVDRVPAARLLVVGEGPLRAVVERLIDALSLREEVRLLGFRRDTATIYAAADVCVLTSSGWEAFGLMAVEAQAAAAPVVVSDTGGAREAILPDESGFLVPPRDAGALAAALLEVLSHAALRERLGRAGRAYALAHFQRPPMIGAMQAVYAAAARLTGADSARGGRR